jgi:hypothetical protein
MVSSRALCAVVRKLKMKKDERIVSAAGAAREERRSGDRTALSLFYRAFDP